MTVEKRQPSDAAMTALEVARYLGVHNNTVKKIPPAELPYFRVGGNGARRYTRADVDAYVEARKVTA